MSGAGGATDRERVAERLRQIAESQRMDFDSPNVGALLDEAADMLTPAPVTVTTVEELGQVARIPQTAVITHSHVVKFAKDALAEVVRGCTGVLPATVLTRATAPDAEAVEPTVHEVTPEQVEAAIKAVDDSPAVTWSGAGGAREVLRAALKAGGQ